MKIETLSGALNVDVVVPGSKSITNRALLVAALAGGRSRLTGMLDADDTRGMARAVVALGAEVDWPSGGDTAVLTGTGGTLSTGAVEIDAGQAGTVARFVLPVLAAGSGEARLDGDVQLRARPIGPLVDALRSIGATVAELGEPGRLPLSVSGPAQGGVVEVSGDVSSQFLSGLMLAGPLFASGLAVTVTTSLVSRPYVEMTSAVMRRFGVDASVAGPVVTVKSGAYAASDFEIEPDASAASYFFALAAAVGGRVAIRGLGTGSLQGDLAFASILRQMGAVVREDTDVTEIGTSGGPAPSLRGVEVDMADCSDTVPTLAVVAAFASTPTRISGVGFIRAKESDRIAAVCAGLRACGVDAREEEDGLTVFPDRGRIRGGLVETKGDHRLAMAFTVLGLAVPGVELDDPDCVAKTFPEFFSTVDALRGR